MEKVVVLTKVASLAELQAGKATMYDKNNNGAITGKIISANSTILSDGKYLTITTTIITDDGK